MNFRRVSQPLRHFSRAMVADYPYKFHQTKPMQLNTTPSVDKLQYTKYWQNYLIDMPDLWGQEKPRNVAKSLCLAYQGLLESIAR